MKDLEEIKQEYAKECGFASYQDSFWIATEDEVNEIAERYANEVCTHALQEAAEIMEVRKVKHWNGEGFEEYNETLSDCQEIILSLIKEKQH